MQMAGKMKKVLLEEIHPLHIIREVEKWPALYVKDSTDRFSKHSKLKIWTEVAKALFPEWEGYSKLEQDVKISDLSRKWRNLRDTYKRQVEIEKKIRDGHNIKKKVYVFYSHMAFLRPHIAGSDDEAAPAPEPRRARTPRPPRPPRRQRPAVFLPDIDEDKHFVLSLIPSLKKMTEDEKLTAKMEILKAIKGVRSGALSYPIVDALGPADHDIKKEVTQAELEDALDLDAMDSDDELSS